jgi:hypothetical protein
MTAQAVFVVTRNKSLNDIGWVWRQDIDQYAEQ